MNKQYKSPSSRGIEWTDYTWNPVKGCFHACQWSMPDGSIANCYAEDVAGGVAQAAYPHGFEHHYWQPELLDAPTKVRKSAKIFTGSMADVFGHWVLDEQILAIINTANKANWHTFQLLTKNPVRASKFALPDNVWLGASTPPDFMWNKPLSDDQKRRMLERTLKTFYTIDAGERWLSAEPLSWDIAPILAKYPGAISWIVIGAASNGKKKYAPNPAYFENLIAVCGKQGIPVFFKGNLRSLPLADANWREEFPR